MATKKIILKEIVDGAIGDSIFPQTSIDQVEGLEEALGVAGSVSTISVNGGSPLTPDANKNIDITIPSTVTESTVSGWGFTKNSGTITGITMNGASKGTSGVVDLGTVVTDVSGKEDRSNKVTSFSSPTDMQYPSAKLVSDQLATKQDTISDIATIRNKADTAIQSVTVGTTTTGAAGTNASVVNSGTATAPVLDFTIPQGEQGVKGDTVIMGGESSYTLYNTAGDAVDGAMTQQAVTRELTELEGDVDSRTVITEQEEIALSSFTSVKNNIITAGGIWSGNDSDHRFYYKSCQAGDKFIIQANATNPSYYAWLASTAITNKTASGSVDFATGETNRHEIAANTTTGILTAPEGTAFLYLCYTNNTTVQIPQHVYSVTQTPLKTRVNENTTDIEAMKTKTTQGETLLAQVTTGVLIDARTSESTFGSEITFSTTTYGTTGFIDVAGHTELHIYGTLKSTSNSYANITGGVFYDANKDPIEEGVFVIGSASTSSNGWIVRTIPENAAYFRLTQGHSGVGSNYYFVDIRNWQDETTHIKEIAVGAKTASGTSYDSHVSGLTATNVQDAIDEINGSIQPINDFETDSFTGTSNITVSKVTEDNGWLITNVQKTGENYALYSLPSLTVGETYVVEFDYVASLSSPWWWGEVGSNTTVLLSHGITIPSGAGHMKVNLVIDNGARYLRLASNSQNSGKTLKICNLRFYQPKSINERVTALENGSGGGGGGNDMESLVRQAVYGKDVSLLHFSDIHGDTSAANAIKKFYTQYSSSIDDMASTGDVVYYYWNDSGGGYEWWQSNGIPEALFVIGNHDGADESSSSDTWKEGSANWDYKGKAWDYDTYFANYITARGIDMPTGYDDSTSARYKCLYWKKDYPASATGHSGVRVIGLDCIHYNDGFRFTSNDQEDWLTATLAETLDSTNAAYGYHVVIMCHYPLDGFNGSNETWNDSTHKWVYNQNANGGIVMDNGKRVNFHWAATSSMTQEVKFSLWRKIDKTTKNTGTDGGIRIGNIISSWINGGGKFVAWICGHHHVNYMFYPQQFPNILNITIAQAGNARGNAEGNRNTGYDSHTCANLYAVNTASSLLKIVRVGFTQKANLVSTRYLCINYETGEVISEG